jgi:DNA-binding transcriptional LysR family regulator
MPELRHLRYFVAVAEELNFSRAARRLRMAQPPLSVAIRQLETELGTELFQRSSREVTLTEAGRVLLDGARRTLEEADRAVTAARRAGAGELGSLRVGFSWSARFETLPAIGRALRQQHPDVELLTEEMWNARMTPALRAGTIDVAISLCAEISPELAYEQLQAEPVIALLAAGHPLAGEQSVALSSLAEEEFVLFPRELAPRLYDTLVGLCRRAGFEPTPRKESFHTDWELRVLADVPGVTLVPQSVARFLPRGVVAVPVSEPSARLDTSVVWRPDDNSPTVAAFLALAREVCAPDAVPPAAAPLT